jgi:hypothetical protein
MVTIGATEYDSKWDDHPLKYDADKRIIFEHHPRWDDSQYLQWLREIWQVKIYEDARHLWPGQWLISGEWQDERDLYKKYEKEWEKRRDEAWAKKHPPKPGGTDASSLQALADGTIDLNMGGEDYFHWNVQTPGWSMHRNGTWNKMLISPDEWLGNARATRPNKREDYPGIFNSYEHACKTLANYCDLVAPRFRLGELTDYEKHLKDFVENYDYTR